MACRAQLLQQQLFSGQGKPSVTNWADTDDDDDFDDDIGPLPSSWVRSRPELHQFGPGKASEQLLPPHPAKCINCLGQGSNTLSLRVRSRSKLHPAVTVQGHSPRREAIYVCTAQELRFNSPLYIAASEVSQGCET